MNPLVKRTLKNPIIGAMVSPLSVDDYLGLIDASLSLSLPRGRVVSATRTTPDSVTLAIAPNDNWAGHAPGQHLLLGVELDGIRHSRCFSVASAPGDPLIEITVKRNGDGRVSNYLVDHAARGQLVHLSSAEGMFCSAERAPEAALLLSAGSGITPIMSVLRHWLATGRARDVICVHYARTRVDAMYADELADLATRHAGLRVVPVFTSSTGGRRIDAQSLNEAVPDLAERETWLCGPAGFMETAEQLIDRVSAQPIHREHFAATRREAAAGKGKVHFVNSDKRAAGDGGSLLEVAEGAGLTPAYGCRMGICHACKCRVASGRVRDLRSDAVREVRDTDIQLCIHAAAGDVAVEL